MVIQILATHMAKTWTAESMTEEQSKKNLECELSIDQLETIKGASMHQGAMNSAFKDAAGNISTGQPVEQPLSKRRNPTVETHIDFAELGVKDEWHIDK